jgi:hypothetical protein
MHSMTFLSALSWNEAEFSGGNRFGIDFGEQVSLSGLKA